MIVRVGEVNRPFPPEVAVQIVKLACELPSLHGLPIGQWDCTELARTLVDSGVVKSISSDTVRRVLLGHELRPWRVHAWLSPQVPRDQAFVTCVQEICDLYTRPLAHWEAVLCVDEKTNLQPRPRRAPTLPAEPGKPVRAEHGYRRKGALHLFAAFNTRSGEVISSTSARKRATEFIAFLDHLDEQLPGNLTTVHLVLDNLSVHKSKAADAWLREHPRFIFHYTPVHCSWMNQVEQWFSILHRKRLRVVNFADKADLAERLLAFIAEWNDHAHPFNWTGKSVAKVMAKCEPAIAA
jgi:transposase